jgi:hypothetical protein
MRQQDAIPCDSASCHCRLSTIPSWRRTERSRESRSMCNAVRALTRKSDDCQLIQIHLFSQVSWSTQKANDTAPQRAEVLCWGTSGARISLDIVMEPTKQNAGERRAREKVKPVPKIRRQTKSNRRTSLCQLEIMDQPGKISTAHGPGSCNDASFASARAISDSICRRSCSSSLGQKWFRLRTSSTP